MHFLLPFPRNWDTIVKTAYFFYNGCRLVRATHGLGGEDKPLLVGSSHLNLAFENP